MKVTIVFRVVLLLAGAHLAPAQTESGLISGTVTDPSGAIVRDAKVEAVEIHTRSLRSTSTNRDGFYSFTHLVTGQFEISIEAPGFAPIAAQVQVSTGDRITVDARLHLAEARGDATVVAEGNVRVEMQSPMLSEVISAQQLTQLPTLTRNPYDLVLLLGDISPGDPAGRGVGVAINGQRAASTHIQLDGGENTRLYLSFVGQAVPLDSVQEFRLSQSTFTAEYGRASGGMVDVETRSGTNGLHGSAYEFNRISALAANSYDNNARGFPRGVFTRNQFGYSLGGPILRNRLFFFQSTEWTRVRSAQSTVALVPTQQFIAAADPATQAYFTKFAPGTDPVNGPVVTKADIVAEGIDPPGPFSLLPDNTPVFGQAVYTTGTDAGGGNPQNSYSAIARLDYSANERTKLFGRYALEKHYVLPGVIFSNPYPGYSAPSTQLNKNLLLGATRVFSSSVVAATKFGWNRLDEEFPLGAAPSGPDLYFSDNLNVFGVFVTLPGYGFPRTGTTQYEWHISQDLTWTKGRHVLRGGGEFLHNRHLKTGLAGGSSSQVLANDPGRSLDNFLLGEVQTFSAPLDPQGKFPCVRDAQGFPVQTPACTLNLPLHPVNPNRTTRNREGALYIQDTWRAHPRLTLSLGLRWEYYGVQYSDSDSPISNFYPGAGATIPRQIRNGQVLAVSDSPIHALYRPDYNNFGPRIGFAWDLFGDGRTSLRGGYGISYERNFGQVLQNLTFNPPGFAVSEADAGTNAFPTLPVTTDNLGPFAGTTGSIAFPPAIARQVDPNIRTAYAETWSLSLERQLMPNTMLGLSYTGSHGVHLYSLVSTDLPGSGIVYGGDDPAVDPFSTLNRQYGGITTRGNGAFSIYHALQVKAQAQNIANTGLTFLANYTWAHALDNTSSTLSEYSNDFAHFGFLDFLNPALDRGDAEFDVRHRFVASAIWQIPTRGSQGWRRALLGGWSVAPILAATSGIPFSISDCSLALSICPRYIPSAPVQTTGHPVAIGRPNFFKYIPLPPPIPYVNPVFGFSDFGDCTQVAAPPCPFPANMTHRDAFRGPGEWNLDFGAYKSFRLREGWTLQFRAELFDAFNHANLFVRTGQADIAIRSFIAASRDGNRNVQLAAKVVF